MLNVCLRLFIGVFELISTIACNLVKIWTDQLARQTTIRNQKYSREWGLLRNVTWTKEGNNFANITYGGYTIFTALLLFSRCCSKEKHSKLGKSLLVIGILMFLTLGSFIFASIEEAPIELHTNAYILGSLSYFVAFLFVMDLTFDNYTSKREYQPKWTTPNIPAVSNKKSQTLQTNNINTKNSELQLPITDIVKTATLPTAEEPIFAKLLLPEKQRAKREPKVYNALDFTEEKVDKPYKIGYVANMAKRWENRKLTKSAEISSYPVV